MLKLSATQLETYRRYLSDKVSLRQLIEWWTTKQEPSLKMVSGSIFHAKLQGMQHAEDSRINFDENDIIEARQKLDLSSEIFEYKLRVPIQTKHGKIMFTGVADQIVGNIVHEYKTTYSSFNYDQYAESMQWRAYCHIFGVEKIKYHVWTLSEPKGDGEIIKVKDYNSMTMYSNSSTQFEFLSMVEKAVDLIYMLNLQKAPNLIYI